MTKLTEADRKRLIQKRERPLASPSDLGDKASQDIAGAMNALLADVFALHLKTKSFHWHLSGPHFRDYHLLLDEQAERSEEHTSELQSQSNIVCRLLLEKKKKKTHDF